MYFVFKRKALSKHHRRIIYNIFSAPDMSCKERFYFFLGNLLIYYNILGGKSTCSFARTKLLPSIQSKIELKLEKAKGRAIKSSAPKVREKKDHFLTFFVTPTSPTKPIPRRNMVDGSGMERSP